MDKIGTVRMRVTPEEKVAFERAAELAGISFSAWARMNLRRAAMREFEDAGIRVDFQPKLKDRGSK
ncbi:MAG TPA: hypothetical protein VIG55_04840 [Methylosinus sp.]